MKFYSTNKTVSNISLEDAITAGLASDGGLLMPKIIPQISQTELQTFRSLSFVEVAANLTRHFFNEDFSESEIQHLMERAFNFPLVLNPITTNISALELFHGPTLAFKDFGARFLAALLEYYLEKRQQKLTIVVATSGDTGGAVAQAFHKSSYVDVVLLFPSGKVSELQEKQLTTLGDNITALEVLGTFDDCQAMVKQALSDSEIRQRRPITSANSINVARFIPQSFYYFWAWANSDPDRDLVFCVPSGNFGNLAAGLLAKRMGLPVRQFIAATNLNCTFPDYLKSGQFNPRPSVQTISNAMDVGNPSNYARILDLYNTQHEAICHDIVGAVVNDQITAECIKSVKSTYNYLLDPHGAVAFWALTQYLKTDSKMQGIFLETAHPAKFKDVIDPIIGENLPLPAPLAQAYQRQSSSIKIQPEFLELRKILIG